MQRIVVTAVYVDKCKAYTHFLAVYHAITEGQIQCKEL